jgi:hypothetical protein
MYTVYAAMTRIDFASLQAKINQQRSFSQRMRN